VKEIWETGAHDVLVVEGEDGRRVLLPAAREFLREVDVAGRRVVIDVIPGLLDPA
jgi:16S rRNA processing protein RimM